MIDFHRQRKTTNTTGAGDALRAAQINMAGDASFKHPYYWAPFIAVGSSE
jgi:CHAT domain-containing protein